MWVEASAAVGVRVRVELLGDTCGQAVGDTCGQAGMSRAASRVCRSPTVSLFLYLKKETRENHFLLVTLIFTKEQKTTLASSAPRPSNRASIEP